MQACYVGLGDDEWFFDEEALTLREYFVIKAASGLGRVAFLEGILDEDPAALQVLVWFLRLRAEPHLHLGSVDFRPAALTVRPAVEAPPDPTPAAPEPPPPPTAGGSTDSPTPSISETATSGSSPAGAATGPATWTV